MKKIWKTLLEKCENLKCIYNSGMENFYKYKKAFEDSNLFGNVYCTCTHVYKECTYQTGKCWLHI